MLRVLEWANRMGFNMILERGYLEAKKWPNEINHWALYDFMYEAGSL